MKLGTIPRVFVVMVAVSVFGVSAWAGNLYFQGFEANASGWTVDVGGSIVRVASGGGILHLTAFDGGFYGETHNAENSYCCTGYGTGGYSFFEGNGATPPPYPGSGFSQSIAVYINVNTPKPAANDAAFAVDMSPGTTLTSDSCYPAACADEQLFRLFYTGSNVNVLIPENRGAATSTVYTIMSSGWYTFQITYQLGGSGTVTNDMNILGGSGQLLSSTPEALGTNNGALPNADLAGPGYVWLPQWQNGFSNDVLGIDDVRADVLPTPEPPSGVLLLIGLIGLAGLLYERARTNAGERP